MKVHTIRDLIEALDGNGLVVTDEEEVEAAAKTVGVSLDNDGPIRVKWGESFVPEKTSDDPTGHRITL